MKTVILHGKKISAQSPRHGRPECALWTISVAVPKFWNGKLTDWTEQYDVHPLTDTAQFPGLPTRRPTVWRWLCAQDGSRPIYLQAPEDHPKRDQAEALRRFNQVPGAVRFPMRAIQRRFPMHGGTYPYLVEEPNRFFVDMTGALIAKAIFDGYDCIILNGIGTMQDMGGTARQLAHQVKHRGILYWMATARALGIAVLVEGPSCFATPTDVYAYGRVA